MTVGTNLFNDLKNNKRILSKGNSKYNKNFEVDGSKQGYSYTLVTYFKFKDLLQKLFCIKSALMTLILLIFYLFRRCQFGVLFSCDCKVKELNKI